MDASPTMPAAPPSRLAALEARRLLKLRDRRSDSAERFDWVDEPTSGLAERPVPGEKDAAKALKRRT